MPIKPRDLLFLEECEVVKQESHDPARQVGAILVDASGRIVSTGTNRPPVEMNLTLQDSHRAIAHDSSWKYFVLEHAERNAIYGAEKLGRPAKGATMYSTLFPCADCARAIVAAGVDRLVVPALEPANERDEKWKTHYKYAQQILKASGVDIDYVTTAELVGRVEARG